jgi:hypothetical protein
MQVTYSRRWNKGQKKPLDPVSAEEARRLDEEGDYYTVVFGDGDTPSGYIEVNWGEQYLAVYFLDAQSRPWLVYSFTRLDEDRMFMDSVMRWEYPDDTARAMSGATLTEELRYRQDGVVQREVRDDAAREVRRQTVTDVPLDINWEPVPRFGEWESVARQDREPASAAQ